MRSERRPYTTTMYIWNGVSAVFFSNCITPFHSHDTLQLMFDVRDRFRFRIQDGAWSNYKSLLIRENAIHQLDTNGSVQLIIYLEASCDAALAIKDKYLKKVRTHSPDVDISFFFQPGELEKCLLEPDKELLLRVVQRLLKILSGNYSSKPMDERVAAVLQLVETRTTDKMNVVFLADKVFLSQSRLRSLFKKSTGVSLHRYILWHRIRAATSRIMNGSTIADAAIENNFTDGSHFHKTMLHMFGVSPSQFIKKNSRMNIEVCDEFPLRMETKQYEDRFWNVEKVFR